MAVLRPSTRGPTLVAQSRGKSAPAVTKAGFVGIPTGSGRGFSWRAGDEMATEDDVNSLITSRRLNRMETRLFHDLFNAISGRDAMIEFDGSMAAAPVGRYTRKSRLGGSQRGLAIRAAGRRAA